MLTLTAILFVIDALGKEIVRHMLPLSTPQQLAANDGQHENHT